MRSMCWVRTLHRFSGQATRPPSGCEWLIRPRATPRAYALAMLSDCRAFYGILRVVGKNRLYHHSRATRPLKLYKTGLQRCRQAHLQLPKTLFKRFKTHAVCIAHPAAAKRRNARRCSNQLDFVFVFDFESKFIFSTHDS